MKFLFYLIIFVSLGFSSTQMSIASDSFSADEAKKISIFSGHVKIVKDSDTISSNKVIVKFDKNNKPIFYEANGAVEFSISLKKSTISGSCERLTYNPMSKIYTLGGKVDILELPSKRKLKANKVKIDTINSRTEVSGTKSKPVKFIFNIEE